MRNIEFTASTFPKSGVKTLGGSRASMKAMANRGTWRTPFSSVKMSPVPTMIP